MARSAPPPSSFSIRDGPQPDRRASFRQPSRDFRTIDWETLPKTVAFHAPYILLFSWNFIEVRHIHSGKLVQILQGSDVRCVWDGSGVQPDHLLGAAPPKDGYGDEADTIEPRIHVVMDDPKVPGRTQRGTSQTVSELQPTVLLSVRLSPSISLSYRDTVN